MNSICKQLQTIAAAGRSKMLLAFEELRPLFNRFGIGGITDALKTEVDTESEKNSMRLYKTPHNKLNGPGHGSYQFPPEEIPGANYTDLVVPLPTVSVLEGVVYVDGEICERAAVSNMKNEIRWSRSVRPDPSDQELFEHGRLTVEPLSQAAQGDLIYTHDATAQNSPLGGFVQLMSIAHDMSSLPTYAEAVAAPAHAAAAAAEEAPSYKEKQLDEPVFHRLQTTELKLQSTVAADFSNSATELASDIESAEDPLFLPKDQVQPLMDPLRFNVVFDSIPWTKGRIDITDPVPFGPMDIAICRAHAAGLVSRHAFMSNSGDIAKRVAIVQRTVGPTQAGDISTGTSTTPISTPQKPPPAPRMGPKGAYHVDGEAQKILEDTMLHHMEADDRDKIMNSHNLRTSQM
ncbi:hypothetical protein E8E11_000029, partial [Didymella keratinophila]